MMLAVMGGMAEVEWEPILTRTAKKRSRSTAVAGDGKMGHRPRPTSIQEREVRGRPAAWELIADLAWSYAVGPATIYHIRSRGADEGAKVYHRRYRGAEDP